ncbi:hypothetical protein LMG26690_01340 [Achromobacter animicus]|uniref:Uncharacterized protein n=2 Tax=Achromobacter animicus TaxID=1389935 RepID=A0A6S6ZFI0_9BURK|nr:hypothetical protein LMG26690_01340 [Achromobacter animicus]
MVGEFEAEGFFQHPDGTALHDVHDFHAQNPDLLNQLAVRVFAFVAFEIDSAVVKAGLPKPYMELTPPSIDTEVY